MSDAYARGPGLAELMDQAVDGILASVMQLTGDDVELLGSPRGPVEFVERALGRAWADLASGTWVPDAHDLAVAGQLANLFTSAGYRAAADGDGAVTSAADLEIQAYALRKLSGFLRRLTVDSACVHLVRRDDRRNYLGRPVVVLAAMLREYTPKWTKQERDDWVPVLAPLAARLRALLADVLPPEPETPEGTP